MRNKLFIIILPILLLTLVTGTTNVATASVLAAPTATPTNCIPIKDAVKKGLIKLELSSNGNLFFKDPLHYTITNLSSSPQQICFPAGQIMLPSDIGDQALVVVGTVILMIQMGQIAEGNLFADCINESKHAPSDGSAYTLGDMATDDLLKVVRAIDVRSAKGRLGGQLAIWAVTDQLTLDDLNNPPSSSNEPSLTDTIRPLLCLAQDEVDLGQQLLQDAEVKASLYKGQNPITAYCQSQGIPSISSFIEQAKLWGERTLLLVGLGICGCLILIVAMIALVIHMARGRK